MTPLTALAVAYAAYPKGRSCLGCAWLLLLVRAASRNNPTW